VQSCSQQNFTCYIGHSDDDEWYETETDMWPYQNIRMLPPLIEVFYVQSCFVKRSQQHFGNFDKFSFFQSWRLP
jgi:hypothetical protein